jgi:hypothetical protein
MKSYFAILLLSFSFTALAGNGVKEAPFYGKNFDAKKSVKMNDVLKNYSKYSDNEVVMEAKVDSVCAKKGCWMTLKGTEKPFRVKFEDYSFFVPVSLKGQKVLVNGQVKRKIMSIKERRHYLEDAGASKEEIAKITTPSYEYRFIAKGVKVAK